MYGNVSSIRNLMLSMKASSASIISVPLRYGHILPCGSHPGSRHVNTSQLEVSSQQEKFGHLSKVLI